jgi:hypothetical protein
VSEIEVVVDVRPNPDAPELILVKQKYTADGGTIRPVGPPSEARLNMAARRVRVTVEDVPNNLVGSVLTAHVQNVGLTPVVVTRVSFDYVFPEQDAQNGTAGRAYLQGIGRGLDFVPSERKKTAPLLPGETRDWYLPTHLYGELAYVSTSFPPDHCSVVAYSESDEVGRIDGAGIRPVLTGNGSRVVLTQRARSFLDSLRDGDRQTVLNALQRLGQDDPEAWPEVTRFAGNPQILAVRLPISPDFRMMVRRLPGLGVEVMDFIYEDTIRWASQGQDAVGVQG